MFCQWLIYTEHDLYKLFFLLLLWGINIQETVSRLALLWKRPSQTFPDWPRTNLSGKLIGSPGCNYFPPVPPVTSLRVVCASRNSAAAGGEWGAPPPPRWTDIWKQLVSVRTAARLHFSNISGQLSGNHSVGSECDVCFIHGYRGGTSYEEKVV